VSDNQYFFLFLVISFKKENNNKDNDMINDYTIYDTADMYMKTAFPIHEIDNVYTKTSNRIHVRHHIYSSIGLLGIIF
jgi:hypothetical protein